MSRTRKDNHDRLKRKVKTKYSTKKLLPLLIVIIVVSIGYAYLSSVLNIGGRSTIPPMSWNVHFENVVEDNDSVESNSPVVLAENNTNLSFSTSLYTPGDKYSFTVDIVNNGTIDAMVDNIVISGLSANQSKFSEFKATYLDGSSITKNDLLEAGDSIKIRVSIEYLDVDSTLLNTTDESLNLSVDIDYVQADDNAVKKY